MNKVIVTPAGRKRYLTLLLKNLLKNKQYFDEWHLWLNTTNQEDLEYCNSLSEKYSWIKLIKCTVPINGNKSIGSFFKNAIDDNSVYLRLDDDVVYLEKDFCKKIFEFRLQNPQFFIVLGNVINNAVMTHIHQKIKAIEWPHFIDDNPMGNAWNWGSAPLVESVHRQFIENLKTNLNCNTFHYEPVVLSTYRHVSINCISWLGDQFKQFNGIVGAGELEEEAELTTIIPRQFNKPNVIFGNAVCSHFSFFTQREHMDKTNLLELYDSVSEL